MTVQGVNWFWPLKIKAPKAIANTPLLGSLWHGNGYFALPLLGTAGSMRETLFGALLALYAGLGIIISLLSGLL